MNKVERRKQPGAFRVIRAGERPRITGYAAIFNSRSENLGGFYEFVRPGAFARSLAAGVDVRAVIEHAGGLYTLGRVANKTLRLAEDEKGLKVRIDPPETQTARDAVELVRRGYIDQMSFAFRTIKDEWWEEGGELFRALLDVDLVDVSLVTWPAYSATEAQVSRALAETAAEGARRIAKKDDLALFYKEKELEILG
ncbi:MAG: HK97 family phage prohead protease [bacterium]